jgi:uncharacterized protein YpmB
MRKAIIIIVIILAAGVAAWYFFSRRKRPYEDYGRADWAGDTSAKTLAFRLSHKPSVKVGDVIDIVQDNGNAQYKQINGLAEVTEVLTPSQAWDKTSHWIVTDKPHPGNGAQEPGTYKKK